MRTLEEDFVRTCIVAIAIAGFDDQHVRAGLDFTGEPSCKKDRASITDGAGCYDLLSEDQTDFESWLDVKREDGDTSAMFTTVRRDLDEKLGGRHRRSY